MGDMGRNLEPTPFLNLPAELILNILSYLDHFDLATVSRTCKVLHTHSYDDLIWQPLVARHLGNQSHAPNPLPSYRDLYAAHHPHWFLPQHRIWFSDKAHTGKLLIARYEPQTGRIAAYPVTAVKGKTTLQFWDQDPEVVIHSFDPKISLRLDSPVVILDTNSLDQPQPRNSDRSISRYEREIKMDIPPEPGPNNAFVLCRALPEAAIGPNTHVWPPLRVPAHARTRNASANEFNSLGHRPSTLDEVSRYNFRIRKWMDFGGREASIITQPTPDSFPARVRQELWARFNATMSAGMSMRMPQEITTFATLPPSCYTPTPQKPWQGIWCGDYSGHGCEFLLITQPDAKDAQPLPEGMIWLGGQWTTSDLPRRDELARALDTIDVLRAFGGADVTEVVRALQETGSWSSSDDGPSSSTLNGDASAGPSQQPPSAPQTDVSEPDDQDGPSGRLEAIKLTGDLNVPRGEYTFIAPDLGPGGLLRVAHEPVFRGARVVRSAGHVAGQNFSYDQYTHYQLILISHDELAHYWERMGNISYYRRVDLDSLVDYDECEAEMSRAEGKRAI